MMIPMYPVISWCYSKIYAVQDYIWWTSSKARSNLAGFHKPTRSFVHGGTISTTGEHLGCENGLANKRLLNAHD